MLISSYHEPIEKYKDYKNRTVQKNIDRLNTQLWNLKQCSLKQEDKEISRKKLLELITNFKM